MEKVAKNGRKVKAIALLFLLFFASFSKIEKSAKNGRKVKAIALLFVCFFPLFQKLKNRLKWTKSKGYILADFSIFERGKKEQKSKAIAFTFRPFLADFSIFEKEAKNSQKVRL